MTTPLFRDKYANERLPAWQRVVDLFVRHGQPAPPWRLRDELVAWLCAYDARPTAELEAAVEKLCSAAAQYALARQAAPIGDWEGHIEELGWRVAEASRALDALKETKR